MAPQRSPAQSLRVAANQEGTLAPQCSPAQSLRVAANQEGKPNQPVNCDFLAFRFLRSSCLETPSSLRT